MRGGAMQKYLGNTKIFTAFFDDTRLKILEILRSGEISASKLLERVNVGQSTLSHHMKILVESGIVTVRKAHRWKYYSICDSGKKNVMEMLKQLEALMGNKTAGTGNPCV
jgi:ArsR family transcriptional regulator